MPRRPPTDRSTEVFVVLPSGAVPMSELKLALARLTEGVASWSDVRTLREALEFLEASIRGR